MNTLSSRLLAAALAAAALSATAPAAAQAQAEGAFAQLYAPRPPAGSSFVRVVNPGTAPIKVKLASSLIGISSIQLLQSFIQIGSPQALDPALADAYYRGVLWQIVLHVVFVISALLLALTDLVMMRRHRAGEKDAH